MRRGLLLVLLIFSRPVAAVINKGIGAQPAPTTIHQFPEPPLVKKQLKFWNAIFVRFPSTSVLIHDTQHPEVVVDLIDLEVFAKTHGKALLNQRKKREAFIEQYVKRYEWGLRRFAKLQMGATKLGAIEERLYNVYRRNPQALRDLFQGRASIRSQAGLADEFKRAADRARPLLPYMEHIFVEQGLPIELTRLAFVESMFNTAALSKVGASGIWQFMPDTARRFQMRVDSYIDERNSPIKATKGAARLLLENYRNLGSWPLAITAYNHGPASINRAVKQVGTKSFETILTQYRGPSFGFASRNFYAEFLSARNVFRTLFKEKRNAAFENRFTKIPLHKPVSLGFLMRKTPLTRDILVQHNPCLLPKAFSRYQFEALPAGFEIIVPRNLAAPITQAINTSQTARAMRF